MENKVKNMDNLSEQTQERIERECLDAELSSSYYHGAVREARLVLPIIEAVKGVLYSDGKTEQREVLRMALERYEALNKESQDIK